MACDFTRADVDNLCRALNEASRIEWVMETDLLRKCTKPLIPTKIFPRTTFDHLAKVTGARIEKDVAFSSGGRPSMDMVSYGGVLFYAFQGEGPGI